MAKAEIIPQANELCRISADIRIDGVFEGTVYTKGKLVIGEAAHVKGKVFCQNCDLWGHAEGEMYIEDIINFKANSDFSGDLKTPKLLSPLLLSLPRNNPLYPLPAPADISIRFPESASSAVPGILHFPCRFGNL